MPCSIGSVSYTHLDVYKRQVYIKECARIMDIDENILISEVARKRMSTTGDRETDEFVRA